MRLVSLIRNIFHARRGRPVALVILLFLSVINIGSEWPANIPQPVYLQPVTNWISGNFFNRARRLLFDSYQRRYPRVPESQPVTIVAIDEPSLVEVGQWPWPRNLLAQLIDRIAAMGPLAVGLDIYMPEPDQTSPGRVADNLPPSASELAESLRKLPGHDAALAASLNAAPTILGAAGFDHAAMTTSNSLLTAPVVTHGANALPYLRHFDQVLASLPSLQAAAHGQALLSVALEEGRVRRIPLVMALGDKAVPGLAMEMLRVATGSSAVEIYSGERGIQAIGVADVVVPVQPFGGDIWLHFARLASTADRYVSARDILDGTADPQRFQNRLVLLGLTGAGLHDMRTTALGELVPGIEIQAQVIETIFDGRFLYRPPWLKWAEVLFTLLLGLLLIWYMPRTDSRLASMIKNVPGVVVSTGLGLCMNFVIISIGFAVFQHYGLLVDAATIFIIASAVMASLLSSAALEINRKSRAEAAERFRDKERHAYEAGWHAGANGTALETAPEKVPSGHHDSRS